jgi:hypothetical protein
VEMGGDEIGPPRPRENLIAAALGLAAMGLACIPLTVFLLAPDDPNRVGLAFADAKNWAALRWFCLASALGIGPVFALARYSQIRARHSLAAVPAALAQFLALPMIAGTVMQISWWISG